MPQKREKERELDHRTIRTNQLPPWWADDLVDDVAYEYRLEKHRPRVVFVPARYEGSFAGRHFPDENVVSVLDGSGDEVARATLLHELTHWIRKHRGDPKGKHDRNFFLLADELYEKYGVPQKLASYVENCDGPTCQTKLIRRVR